ncbi:unnamed protein product [Urochloa humidicola]
MELMLPDNIIPMLTVVAVSSAAALYARAVSSRLGPGLPRLVGLLPVAACFVVAPFVFSTGFLRSFASAQLTWLGMFKLGLLAAGHGPLHPGLPALHFIMAATLPVQLVVTGGKTQTPERLPGAVEPLASCVVRIAAVAALHHHGRLHQPTSALDAYVRTVLYGTHLLCTLELAFICAAATLGGTATVKPQFVRPYLTTSLRDFWGRRWNQSTSAVLRAAVYDPLRRRAGKDASLLATFLVSGMMHEVIVYYLTLRRPSGAMTAYFALQGVCRVAEGRWAARGWPTLPWPVSTLLMWVFMTTTSVWMLLETVCRDGRDGLLFEPPAVDVYVAAPVGICQATY